jgi:hypothetical protein
VLPSALGASSTAPFVARAFPRRSTIDASMMSSDFARKSLWTFFVEAARGKKSTLGLWIWERSSEAADLKVAATKADPSSASLGMTAKDDLRQACGRIAKHVRRAQQASTAKSTDRIVCATRTKTCYEDQSRSLVVRQNAADSLPSFVGAGPSPVRVNRMTAKRLSRRTSAQVAMRLRD